MKFRNMAVLAVGGAMAVSLAACGTNPAGNNPAGTTDYAKLVGIVLPTNSESRWPAAEAQFKSVMPGATVLYSNKSTATEKTNVESLINQGVKYIVICAQDAAAAAAAVDEAHAAGIKVIAYDRLITGTKNLDYYVTFDSVDVGKAQGQYLVDQAKGQNNNLYLYAGAASDNNAFLFFQGAWSVLQPKIADGTFRIVNSPAAVALQGNATLTRDQQSQIIGQITTNWDPTQAQTLAQANLAAATADQKGDVFLLTPNDDGARPIADAFRADSAVTTVYSTGQDFTLASLQYILDGKQSMTVWKSDTLLVKASQKIIDAVQAGNTKPDVIVTTYDNGAGQIPSTKEAITVVTKDNLAQAVADSGMYKIDNGKVAAK